MVRRSTQSPPGGIIGKLFGSVFFAVFAAFGFAFVGFIGSEFLGTLDTYSWNATACTIESIRIDEQHKNDDPFVILVNYRYAVGGREYASDDFALKEKRFDDYTDAQHLLQRYPAGGEATCYVNPDDPAQAVLQRDSLWFGFVTLFPMIFVAIGLGGIWFIWRGRSKSKDPSRAPIVSKKNGAGGRLFGAAFLSIFAIVGLITGWFLLVKPITKYIDARDWPAVPCVIESSTVRSHSSDDGTTYSVDIFYRYEFDGRTFKSNRYEFIGGSSSGRGGKQAIVKQYPRGSERICYVNPADPAEAVLHRGLSWKFLLGLIPIVFGFIGFGGLYLMFRGDRKKSPVAVRPIGERGHAAPIDLDAAALDFLPKFESVDGPTVLKPTSTRLGKLIGTLVFAVFWNGIVSVFLYKVVESHMAGRPEWFLTLFLIPFLVVGLGAIGFVFYQLLAMFNPTVQVTVNRNALPLGEALDVAWDLIGRAQRVTHMRVWLQGREEATYRRGTDTVTDKHVFTTIELANTDHPADIVGGAGSVTIPADTMHSFVAPNNKIIWSLHVHGRIDRWPDIKAEFPVVVLPAAAEYAK